MLPTELVPAYVSHLLPDAWADWLDADVCSGAEQLLIALSVFREPADHSAIVFQVGCHDAATTSAPAGSGPTPPYKAPSDLPWLLAACREARLLAATGPVSAARWQVHPEVAAVLRRRLLAAGRESELMAAHQRAAEYWQWHAADWPQGREADMHDLLEARYHLFRAGDAAQAAELTRLICAQLHAWGELECEAELIQDTLDGLPAASPSWADWTRALGMVYQETGDHGTARRCFAESIRTAAKAADYGRVARGQRSLGGLAQAQGEFRHAQRYYRRAEVAERKAAAMSSPLWRLAAAGNLWPSRAVAATARWYDAARSAHRTAGAGLA